MRRFFPAAMFVVGAVVGFYLNPVARLKPGTAADVTDPEWISSVEVYAPGQQRVELCPNMVSVDDTHHHKVASMNGPTWRVHLKGNGKQVSLLAVEPRN